MFSFVLLCVFLGIGHVLRMKIRLLRTLYLPGCVIGGLAALLFIQLLKGIDPGDGFINTLNGYMTVWSEPWKKLPSMLINIVFACLFLGVSLPKFSTLYRRAGLQLCYGQIVAWGQYFVGIGLFLVLIRYLFPELPGMFAGILPVGFEGGHGTAAGMKPAFDNLGWEAGSDFALASATIGIISAIIFGMILVNWAARRNYTHKKINVADVPEDDTIGIIEIGKRPSAGKLTVKSDAIESLSLHIVVVGLAIGLGIIAKQALIEVERAVPYIAKHKLLSSFPLFPLCMLGGLVIQYLEERYDRYKLVDIGLIRRIQNTSLDFLVVAAIAAINLNVIKSGFVPLILLALAGILWNVFCVVFIARKVFKDAWFERSIAEMGQSMGVTATGLLLLRVVDPDYESPAADAFATKQLMHEPVMGGGLWTAMAIPLIAAYGPARMFLVVCAVMIFWFFMVFLTVRARRK